MRQPLRRNMAVEMTRNMASSAVISSSRENSGTLGGAIIWGSGGGPTELRSLCFICQCFLRALQCAVGGVKLLEEVHER